MSVNDLLRSINKAMGDNTVMCMSDQPTEIDVIPTGCLTLDVALGVGGIGRGRITEIFGTESCGKTTLGLHIVREAQQMGLLCAYIDVEQAMDTAYAKTIGVDMENLIFAQPACAEETLTICEKLTESGSVGLIIVDSVASMCPKAEIEGDMETQQIGLISRILGKYFRRNVSALKKNNTAIVFINQVRSTMAMYGDPIVSSGGKSLKYHASYRIKIQKLDTNNDKQSYNARATVVKNKTAVPFKQAEFEVVLGKGIDSIGCIVDVATDKNIIEKSGGWYKYGENKWQGKEKVKQALVENEELQNEIKQRIK